MTNFFPRQTVAWKLEEPPAFRRLTLSVVEMAVLTGVVLRLLRSIALTQGPADSWIYLGGAFAVDDADEVFRRARAAGKFAAVYAFTGDRAAATDAASGGATRRADTRVRSARAVPSAWTTRMASIARIAFPSICRAWIDALPM